MLIAPLLLLGCGEEPTIERYEVTRPAAYDWPATQRREASHEVDGITWVWEVPAGWMDAPEVTDQLLADYRFPGTTEALPGRLTVSMINGDGGGIDANVARWQQQLYVTTPRGLGPQDRVSEPMAVPVGRATFVELAGQYQGEHVPTHVSAAIVQIPAEGGGTFQTWFFKLAGDAATVEANRLGMARMVLSFRPQGVQMPELPEPDVLLDPQDVEPDNTLQPPANDPDTDANAPSDAPTE